MLLRRGRQAFPLLPGMLSLCPWLGKRILLVLIFHSALHYVNPAGVCFCQSHKSRKLEKLLALLWGRSRGWGGEDPRQEQLWVLWRRQGRGSRMAREARAVLQVSCTITCLCACCTLPPFCPPDKAFSQLLTQPLCSPWKAGPCEAVEPEPAVASVPYWGSCACPALRKGPALRSRSSGLR